MIDRTSQQKIAQELRSLADNVEVSGYCRMTMDLKRPSIAYYKNDDFVIKDPTGEVIVNIELTYVKENT